jgi:hypothetical protein
MMMSGHLLGVGNMYDLGDKLLFLGQLSYLDVHPFVMANISDEYLFDTACLTQHKNRRKLGTTKTVTLVKALFLYTGLFQFPFFPPYPELTARTRPHPAHRFKRTGCLRRRTVLFRREKILPMRQNGHEPAWIKAKGLLPTWDLPGLS